MNYSDFWADPGKQRKPKAWADYDADRLEQAVYDFTKEMMSGFIKEGAVPDMVQVGNELSNGFRVIGNGTFSHSAGLVAMPFLFSGASFS